MAEVRPVEWTGTGVAILDQRLLPGRIESNTYADCDEVARSIRNMEVRGAPAIGCAAAFGLVLVAEAPDPDYQAASSRMRSARPTAVNLMWAVDRMDRARRTAREQGRDLRAALLAEAEAIASEDEASCRAIGDHGARLVPRGAGLLTHCNAGALATYGYGTALGVVRSAAAADPGLHVYVDETRPYLQGARLTSWELVQEGIPHTLITDNAAAHFMARGEIDLVVVGADRIAANGDVANKIGTYGLAVLARYHEIPFYVAAPLSTFDPGTRDGSGIPIESRSPEEVVRVGGIRLAPEGVEAAHPAFDVTPAALVSALVTEVGILYPPYWRSIPEALGARKVAGERGP